MLQPPQLSVLLEEGNQPSHQTEALSAPQLLVCWLMIWVLLHLVDILNMSKPNNMISLSVSTPSNFKSSASAYIPSHLYVVHPLSRYNFWMSPIFYRSRLQEGIQKLSGVEIYQTFTIVRIAASMGQLTNENSSLVMDSLHNGLPSIRLLLFPNPRLIWKSNTSGIWRCAFTDDETTRSCTLSIVDSSMWLWHIIVRSCSSKWCHHNSAYK